jgi:hypothetical protein
VEDKGPADPIPDLEASPPCAEDQSGSGERKLRCRLIKFQDMRPGLEPAYLVDELIPSAGLVLVWGKQKTFKSFCCSTYSFMSLWGGHIAITPSDRGQ